MNKSRVDSLKNGPNLIEKKQEKSRFLAMFGPKFPGGVKDAVIAVTYRCNSRCQMCNIWKKTNHAGEMTLEDFSNLPASIRDINLSGGEPFLRGDLIDIIRLLIKRNPKVNIIISTNAFATDLISKQIGEILSVKPGIGVAVSIDGVGRAHDTIRGIPGGFDLAMQSIKAMRAAGLKNLKLGFTLGDYNYKEMRKVYKLAGELNAEFSLAVVHSSDSYFGKDNKINKKEMLIEELEWLIREELKGWNPKKWGRAYFAHGIKYLLETGKRILPDYSGRLNIFIDPFGNVYPCDISSKTIGNLKYNEFSKDNSDSGSCDHAWMMCTARQAIKKHWLQAGLWILNHRF